MPHSKTLYASAHDKALWLSWITNVFSRRAGFVSWGLLGSGKPVVAAGLDSIDASNAGRDWFAANHDVYAANPIVTNDMRRLLQTATHPPDQRSGSVLQSVGKPPEQYWTLIERRRPAAR